MKNACYLLMALLLCHNLNAQNRLEDQSTSAVDIYHSLEKLKQSGRVLYIAAHPDDENTKLISYLSNHVNAHTAYLSLTRGDGGQNLIGSELREKLGVIRTQELLEARAIDGGEQFFTRANDFGYSKHPVETLDIWDRKAVLSDMVKVIRMFRPHVIVNRFDHRTPGTTHGHHTASAMLSMEAMDLAADPNYDAGHGLPPHQVERAYFNTSWWFYGSREAFAKADKSNLTAVDVGRYDPLTGISSTEIAALSRSQHQSQGFGSGGSRGSQLEWLELIKGKMPRDTTDFFSGINTVTGKGEQQFLNRLSKVIAAYNFTSPSKNVPELINLLKTVQGDRPWQKAKRKQLNKIILDASGIFLSLTTDSQNLNAQSTISADLEAINRSMLDVEIQIEDFAVDTVLPVNTRIRREVKVNIPKTFSHPSEVSITSVADSNDWIALTVTLTTLDLLG